MDSNPFSEQYKKLTNAELVVIIDNPNDYQELALEAAQIELNGRNLSEQQLNEVKAHNESQLSRAESKYSVRIDQGFSKLTARILDSFKTIRSEDKSKDKLINILSIVYGLFSFYLICIGINYLLGSRGSSDSDLFEAFWFSPFTIILPLAVVFFWLRTKIGWILFCIYWSYQFFLIFWLMLSSPRKIDLLSMIEFVIGFLASFIFWPSFRKLYNIDLRTAIITAGGTIVVTIIFLKFF